MMKLNSKKYNTSSLLETWSRKTDISLLALDLYL